MNVAETWRVFLVQLEFARYYPMAYQLERVGPAVRNPLLEMILPTLLHMKMMAIADEAFHHYLDDCDQVPATTTYQENLYGRITSLTDRKLIDNGEALQDPRLRRNAAAHQVTSDVSWKQLDSDLLEVQCALERLGLAGERPNFDVRGERSALRESSEPGVLGERDFIVSVHEGTKLAGEYRWQERIYDDDG